MAKDRLVFETDQAAVCTVLIRLLTAKSIPLSI